MEGLKASDLRAPCRNFASTGFCRFGDRCRYSHDIHWRTTRPPPESTPCIHWETSGTCPYSDRCAYYHKPDNLKKSSLLHDDPVNELHRFATEPRAPGEPAVIASFQEVASYSWIVAETPTIEIPGILCLCT